jgi:hypothetical protein
VTTSPPVGQTLQFNGEHVGGAGAFPRSPTSRGFGGIGLKFRGSGREAAKDHISRGGLSAVALVVNFNHQLA